ncbi:Uncharacterised protein [Escherichia coli]|uniref:Uncharacterized protein n=1 Tax=Escherichia coli TaxID=562 RepID=A0A376L147_ECOLX|nr:Uncharacterised protein [Escherichia coli]
MRFVQHLHQRRILRLPAFTLAVTIVEQLLLQLPEIMIRLLQRGELVVKLHAVTLRASGNQRRGRIFTRRRREFFAAPPEWAQRLTTIPPALCAPPVASDEDVSPTCILFLKRVRER